MELAANQSYIVQAKLQIESFAFSYVTVHGGTIDTLRNDIALSLNKHVGKVDQLRVNVFESWLASDTVDIAFVVTPSAPIATGETTAFAWEGAAFNPPNSVSKWVWYGANLRADVFFPYAIHTAGVIWTDTAVVTSSKPGTSLPQSSTSESTIGGLFRSLNSVRSSDPELDGRTAFSVRAGEALQAATSWEIVPAWAKLLLTALPIAIIVGGTVWIGSTAYRMVKG